MPKATNSGSSNANSATAPDLSSVLGGAKKLAVTGSRGGNAALASLLTQLAKMGLITDATS